MPTRNCGFSEISFKPQLQSSWEYFHHKDRDLKYQDAWGFGSSTWCSSRENSVTGKLGPKVDMMRICNFHKSEISYLNRIAWMCRSRKKHFGKFLEE